MPGAITGPTGTPLDGLVDLTTGGAVGAEVKPVESENPNGEFELILSKDNMDRDGENLWADEWTHPLPPKIHMDSDHAFAKGQSVPYTVGSGTPEINENGDLVVRGTYAGTPHGQLVRQLVKEGHIWQASVSYQEHRSGDGVRRELLNGTFTGVPANPEAVVMSSKSADKKPYGSVTYADPGYQEDGQARYPIDTEDHVRAALSYFGQSKNRDQYTAKQQAAILGRIRSAARRFGIDVSTTTEKALVSALCKAIILTQTTEGNTPENQDVGASSVYDDDPIDGDDDDDYDDDSDDDVAQAVHDAAVALGAACDNGSCVKSHTPKTLPPAGKTADAAPKGAASAVTPADLAARARVRKFQLETNLLERQL